eukprot:scaffold62385_cov42-Phaeocystis_antarctica.AAC.1
MAVAGWATAAAGWATAAAGWATAALAKAAAEWAAAARATFEYARLEASSAVCTDGVVATGIHARCPVKHAKLVAASAVSAAAAHDIQIGISHLAKKGFSLGALESSACAWLAIVLVGA